MFKNIISIDEQHNKHNQIIYFKLTMQIHKFTSHSNQIDCQSYVCKLTSIKQCYTLHSSTHSNRPRAGTNPSNQASYTKSNLAVGARCHGPTTLAARMLTCGLHCFKVQHLQSRPIGIGTHSTIQLTLHCVFGPGLEFLRFCT